MEYFRTHLLPEICKIHNKLQAGVMRVWITNIGSDVLDVQEANSHVSQI